MISGSSPSGNTSSGLEHAASPWYVSSFAVCRAQSVMPASSSWFWVKLV
eukprot:CAMPEP_0115319832 /NCGR_PEP_ID=MMETSP0270-20121206/79990_1 /TAXON_ID=71861 /ORGANISM="Scrippsiella trochoidea, Strain CCMP3099" /LENGTH=48 /DNA_ID= /DNA_START= /DNA_END= /DNA_ORIENTATION=